MNKNTRTDLAIESRVTSVKEGADDGIKTEERELFGFTLTKTEIYKDFFALLLRLLRCTKMIIAKKASIKEAFLNSEKR